MKHFVFLKTESQGEGEIWILAAALKTLGDVKAHMNNREYYPDPTVCEFMVIKGRQLKVEFEAQVRLG